MRPRNHDVFWGDPSGLLNLLSSGDGEAATDPQQVANDKGDLRMPIIEHKTASMQIVVNVRRRNRSEPTDDVETDVWRDVTCGSSGLEARLRCIRCEQHRRGQYSHQGNQQSHHGRSSKE